MKDLQGIYLQSATDEKNAGFEVEDNINIYFNGDDKVIKAINVHKDYIMRETLALEIKNIKDKNLEKQDLNGHDTGVKVEKIQ